MFHLRFLGGAALEQDGVTVDAMGAQRKSLALLAILAVSRGHGISRERLMVLLWPESDTVRARGALKQSLHVVRRQLGSPEVIQGTAELRLNPDLVGSDVDAFLTALEEGEPERAAASYGGPFLDGFHLPASPEFEQWASAQRDDLTRRYTAALERVASAAEGRGDMRAAVEWLRRLHTHDPLHAPATLRLMRGLDALGERAGAIRLAQAHETLFREELDSPPDPEVMEMVERLRQQVSPPIATEQPAPASRPGPEAARPRAPEGPGADLRSRYLGAGFLVVAAGLAAVLLLGGRPGTDATPEVSSPGLSVAVLPFDNAAGDSASAYLADELAEELITVLDGIGGLRVAPAATTTALHRQGFGLQRIADSLEVATTVGGSVRGDGGRLTVEVWLVDAEDGSLLWSAEYDRDLDEILAIQEEITRGVVGALLPSRARATAVQAENRRADAAAYELFLQGRHSWRKRTREGLEQAVVLYEEAVARDPSFSRAWAGLADAYVNLSNFAIRDPAEALARAEVAADRALELDPSLPEGHASKGFVLASRGEFRRSERAFRQAIALGPDYTWGHHYYTLLLLMQDRTDEALEQSRLALSLDPLSLPANATRGVILSQRGDLVGAERELRRALMLAPEFPLALYYLAVVQAALGAHESALELIENVARVTPGFTGVPGARIFLFRQVGRHEAADSLLAMAEAEAAAGATRERLNLALAYVVVGRLDEAFELLDGVRWDVPSMIEVRADPLLGALRTDPRYARLIN